MAPDREAQYPRNDAAGPNPWKFLPFLYLTQAIPPTIVQELSAVFFKDLGVDNALIATWTSIIGLPWSLQFLLGPLVDLSASKRKWIFSGQLVLTALLAILPFFIFAGEKAFVASLIFLAGSAFVSALTNIATDGFYLLSVSKDVQTAFSGIQTGFFRFGRLIVLALTPLLVGSMMKFNDATIKTEGLLFFAVKAKRDEKPTYIKEATLHVEQGELVTANGKNLLDKEGKPIAIPGSANEFLIQNGTVTVNGKTTPIGLYRLGRAVSDDPEKGSWQATEFPTVSPDDKFSGNAPRRRFPAQTAWLVALLALAAVYAGLMLGTRRGTPLAPLDIEPDAAKKSELGRNLVRTAGILGFYASSYFSLSAIWKTIANLTSVQGWKLPEVAKAFGIETGLSGATAELIQLAICAPVALSLFIFLRKSIRGTEMGEAFSSFFRQPGIVAILVFMLFYRFAEAMVAKMSVLFLKDDLVKGGLALDNSQFALIKGTIGIIGIILGGIVGGLLVSRTGLKKGFWIIAVLMHLPILLYIFAAIAKPSSMGVIAVVDFVDQFGYGLGYAGYTIYLMRVAQRGNHRTAHYAIGTGLGATFIALAGILGGTIQASYGYVTVFIAALFFGIPGLITLLFIPHDEQTSAV